MTVVLRKYNSSVFPIAAYWNDNKNFAVYKDITAAKTAMLGRFGKCKFINRMKGA